MKFVKRNGTVVEYYTIREAKKLGIESVHWREARKAGQWVRSDDGYVLKTTAVKEIKEHIGRQIRTRYRIRTGLATRYPHGKRPMNLEEHMKSKNYGIVPTPWWQTFDRRYPALVSVLAKLVIMKKLHMTDYRRYNRAEYAEMIRLADEYSENKSFNWYAVRSFFNHDKVRAMIRERMRKLAEEKGVSYEKIFDLLNEAESLGRGKKDGKVLIQVAKEYAGILAAIEKPSEPGNRLPATEDPQLPGSEDAFDRIIGKNERIIDAASADIT